MSDYSEIKPETFPDQKKARVLDGLPEYLKNPANYEKIRKALIDVIATKHSHGDILEWGACKECQEKFKKQHLMKIKLGFNSSQQYMVWQKTHEKIKTMYPIVDWAMTK